MHLQRFMDQYKKAWETSDEHLLASLFTPDGRYHNTPFSVQIGHEQIRQYWQRTKLQADILLRYDILHADELSGIAHWHTTYRVTSLEMFALWASSTGTPTVAHRSGDPLPRLALDGVAVAEFEPGGLCRNFRIWWHSVAES